MKRIPTITSGEDTADFLRGWYARWGAVQMWLDERDAALGLWRPFARCGPWNPDAPDPELFFPLSADSPQTYRAQAFCQHCPVRQYCDEEATAVDKPGVWGGIFRNDSRRVPVLCRRCGIRTRRYRTTTTDYCRTCAPIVKAEKEAAAAEREARRVARQATVGGPVREVAAV